ncbi:dioxygenase [Microbacterium candidum]|uniref:Dioxygenase n=1 Tax=Microbacterium candidum TaxID=3041922 RepID=A0ABT7MZ76_9MICO|nr:dioxygenase [Microbacterium sp. ASV49]MDL9979758.1 dioxygenase [Microbacterium sp. ASV49]
MATGGKGRADREVRDRNRAYLARKEFHDGQVRRRTRDDVIAGVAGGILILAILGGQILYFTAGPGASHPSPSSTPSPAPSAS